MTLSDHPGNGSSVRLHLLGAAWLARPGQAPLRFLPERRFRLLAYLGVRGEWVSRDQLAALFWPDRTQEAARSNLRKLLLEVRAIDPPMFEMDRNGLRWSVPTDLTQFTAAYRRGDHEAALAVFTGPLLQGIDTGDGTAFACWLGEERVRVQTVWRQCAGHALAQRTPADALDLCQRLLVEDPLDEDAVVAQLNALGALGREGERADVFRLYVTRLVEELGVEPSARVRAAAAPDTALAPAASTLSGSVPSDGFIGRGSELDELCALLTNPVCRLLTITGPGGVGKSRLAKEALRRLAPAYADGTRWIALDDLTDVAQVGPRIAAELRLDIAARQDPVEVVSTHLSERRMLLVLDNSEHLTQLATLVARLLAAAPGLQLLATSRARIGGSSAAFAEWLLPLPGLALPPSDADEDGVLASDAGRLFVAQARQIEPRFDPRASAPHIAAVVRAVAGLPLAILLAAAWVRVLPISDLASDVARSLDVLERSDDGDERPEHRSVRATFERSWQLLVPPERQALMALSAFVGSFSRAAARDVADAPLPLLAALLDKSLLLADGARFSLHPLIQQFAGEKLATEPARAVAMRDRHADAMGRLMSPYASFDVADQGAALQLVAAELPNLLAAWDWATARGRWDVLRLCASGLSNHFQARGPVATGAALFARAQVAVSAAGAATGDTSWAVSLELAALRYWLGDYSEVAAAARHALLAARAASHPFAIRSSLNTLGLAAMRLGRLSDARRYLSEALKRARAAAVAWEIAGYAGNLVAVLREAGELEQARETAREALAGHRAASHQAGQISMYNELGLIAHDLGALTEAVDWYEQGLRVAREFSHDLRIVQLLSHQASARLDLGDAAIAQTLCEQALQTIVSRNMFAAEPTCRRTLALALFAGGQRPAARAQIGAAIEAARRVGTALAIGPVLRDAACLLADAGHGLTALTLVVCADTHRISQAALLPRYRPQRTALAAGVDPAQVAAAESAGAALSLAAGLDLARQTLASLG